MSQDAKLPTSLGGIRGLVSNTSWLLGERALSLALTLVTHIWVARYLGASKLGSLSYATAFVGVFGAFTYLGFSGIVTRDLVANPDEKDEILGTTFALKTAGAVVAFVAAVLLSIGLISDPITRTMVQIQSAALLADGFSVIAFQYHARVEARYPVAATAAASTISAALRITFVLTEAPVLWFAFAAALQTALASITLAAIYTAKGGSILQWRANADRARSLIREAWPLTISAVISIIYLKVDQVMLGYMAGPEETGIYSVAARLSEIWYIVPSAIATSVFPRIVQSRKLPQEEQDPRMLRLYAYMFWSGLLIAAVVSFAANPVIEGLYGIEFARAGTMLAVHIWACPTMFMGAIFAKWLIARGFVMFSLTRDALGATINVGLNLLLIPRLGGVGAAIATVLSYATASYFSCFIDERTRSTGALMTRAMVSPVRYLVSRLRNRRSRYIS